MDALFGVVSVVVIFTFPTSANHPFPLSWKMTQRQERTDATDDDLEYITQTKEMKLLKHQRAYRRNPYNDTANLTFECVPMDLLIPTTRTNGPRFLSRLHKATEAIASLLI